MPPYVQADRPALILAPMEGVTDAPMRALQGSFGAFSFAVSEFLRVSNSVLPARVFRRWVSELETDAQTATGLPVQVQILGGDPDRMAASAINAVKAGAQAIDINFGCPAPTVNKHDGGASLLRCPERIREIVQSVRSAVPEPIPVSAKLRLGWDNIDDVLLNGQMAVEGGASWLTVHARTRVQGYRPPVFWPLIGQLRQEINVPVVANGDIWSIDDFRRCQDETGCIHYMLGRPALANPALPAAIAKELGLASTVPPTPNWAALFSGLVDHMAPECQKQHGKSLMRLKQWMKLAHQFGAFPYFEDLKQTATLDEFFSRLRQLERNAA